MVIADLQSVLCGLEPTLDETRYVFASIPDRSGLEALAGFAGVRLRARVSSALARAGVSCNMVTALHHDHLFVPEGAAPRAVEILRDLQRQAILPMLF